MSKFDSTLVINSKTDVDLCRNACGYYGNKIWDGFCSKCYREVYQQAKHVEEKIDDKISSTTDSTRSSLVQSSPVFSSFQEKRRSHINMRNPLRHMVTRAGNLRSTNNSTTPSLSYDDYGLEQENANKLLDVTLTQNARDDIKSQVKDFANSFHKRCTNKSVQIETLVQDYASFREILKRRMHTNSIYRDENEDLFLHVRDYLEKIVFSRDYSSIFNRIAISCEEKDLSIQHRISSLHWITTAMLDTVLDDNIPVAHDYIYKAMNALIELDSKTTPQGKIHSIMECKSCIEIAIRSSNVDSGINADSFLPALIFIVLKAKPPRLHSNIQFLSHFSQPSGEELYYLANLDSAVRFVELLEAQHLGLSSNDFSLYMRGEPVLPSKLASLLDSSTITDSNRQELGKKIILYRELDHHCEKFDENLLDFGRHLTQTVTEVQELLFGTYSRFPNLDQIQQVIDICSSEQLPDVSKRTNDEQTAVNAADSTVLENAYLPEPLAPQTV